MAQFISKHMILKFCQDDTTSIQNTLQYCHVG